MCRHCEIAIRLATVHVPTHAQRKRGAAAQLAERLIPRWNGPWSRAMTRSGSGARK